jgi:hypothetical protein
MFRLENKDFIAHMVQYAQGNNKVAVITCSCSTKQVVLLINLC